MENIKNGNPVDDDGKVINKITLKEIIELFKDYLENNNIKYAVRNREFNQEIKNRIIDLGFEYDNNNRYYKRI